MQEKSFFPSGYIYKDLCSSQSCHSARKLGSDERKRESGVVGREIKTQKVKQQTANSSSIILCPIALTCCTHLLSLELAPHSAFSALLETALIHRISTSWALHCTLDSFSQLHKELTQGLPGENLTPFYVAWSLESWCKPPWLHSFCVRQAWIKMNYANILAHGCRNLCVPGKTLP